MHITEELLRSHLDILLFYDAMQSGERENRLSSLGEHKKCLHADALKANKYHHSLV